MTSLYTTFTHFIFGKLGAMEISLIGIAALVIQFQIQGFLWQSMATSLIVLGFYYINQKKETKSSPDLIVQCTGILMIAMAFLVFLPTPSHAILLALDAAIEAPLKAIQPPEVGGFLYLTVIGLLWIGRCVLIGILLQMGIKINEGRGQEKSWKELLQDPTIFIISMGIVDRIGNFIVTGALA